MTSRAWVVCNREWNQPHWEQEDCLNPVPVRVEKQVDSILGCVVDEIPAARPGQGEKYSG